MKINVSVLSRSTVNQIFSELLAPAVLEVTGDSISFAPALPTGSDAMELRLRVQPDTGISVAAGVFLDPATRPAPVPILDDKGVQIATEPPPAPMVQREYGVWMNAIRDLPFSARESFIFRRNGTPLTIS